MADQSSPRLILYYTGLIPPSEDKGTYYEVVDISLSDEEREAQDLQSEREELMRHLAAHDYIGVKIATGRATTDEYADEIALMGECADRINEIDERLAELGCGS